MLLAYFAPEVAMPVASVVATVTGFLLAGGRPVISWVARRLRGQKQAGPGDVPSNSENPAGRSNELR
ncbi:hypothetical protein OJF2_08610 [Aquisphaera giovannonii]|uniref:Uncharacterized protein n=1 Tax=Aquisphaera giovannonii TaxID=406548 RepID=A0A5B9VWZ0_9BACT|nr:YcjX family protein [Aquisphaera giovannonii]QEH32391.1 hypothetical protein OJF2_08610 [Aquisphaera giovannonii]